MAQQHEYPMWSPHPKAKLYKRYTGDIPVKIGDSADFYKVNKETENTYVGAVYTDLTDEQFTPSLPEEFEVLKGITATGQTCEIRQQIVHEDYGDEVVGYYIIITHSEKIRLDNLNTITVQGNNYVYAGNLTWTETTAEEGIDEQPIKGLIIKNSYITIRTNSLKQIDEGDIIELPNDTASGGMWIVQEGGNVERIYTPKPVQTFQNLPLSSLG